MDKETFRNRATAIAAKTAERNKNPDANEQGRWLAALYEAEGLWEWTHKDYASMFLEGVPPIPALFADWCDAQYDHATEDEEDPEDTLEGILEVLAGY